MLEQEFRILDILSKELGRPISIRQLATRVLDIYGSGDYKNIYDAIKVMQREKTIILEESGKSLLARLNFENYLLIDLLAEMELKKKQEFLRGKQEMQMLMLEIDTYLRNLLLIKSVSMMDPERNTKLNKAEFVIHLKQTKDRKLVEEIKVAIPTIINALQRMHNIRIDYLLLEEETFLELIKSNEINPIREMLYHKIAVLNPQDFWIEIKKATERGIKIVAEEHETNPAKISETDLVFNLARFGYTEFGPQIKQEKLICIEYIIAAIMFKNDARRIDAIPIILAKNSSKTNYDILLFLARKYGFESRILGILKALRNLVAHGMTAINEPIRLLEAMKIVEMKADKKVIKEKLRLYNVT